MKSTKVLRKLAACVLSITIVLTGVAVSPNTAVKASTLAEPNAVILGASLRTEGNNNGTQSLRIAVQINNASKASACGIKIKPTEKEESDYTVISTENEGYDKIYAKDTTKDTIVYTVVISNIPINKATTDFDIIGFAKKLNSEDEIATEPAVKSVQRVVDALKPTYGDDLTLNASGKLSIITELDLSGAIDATNGGEAAGTAPSVYDSTNEKIYAENVKDILIPLNNTIAIDDTVAIEVNGTCTGSNGDPRARLSKGSVDGELCAWAYNAYTGEKTFSVDTNKKGDMSYVPYLEFKVSAYNSENFDNITINSITISKLVNIKNRPNIELSDGTSLKPSNETKEIDLSKASFENSCATYDTVTKSIKTIRLDAADISTVIYIPTGFSIPVDTDVKVTIKGSSWGNRDFRVWTTPLTGRTSGDFVTNNQVFLNPGVAQGEPFEKTISLTTKGEACANLTLKPSSGFSVKGLVITNITIEVAE